jgi:antitoxin component of RelBE/YafQ-DinJ toxin-antitoxin module
MVEHIHISKYGETSAGYKQAAASYGFPKFQGEYPHLSISISAFNDILFSPIYECLEPSERLDFAKEVQKIICERYGVTWNKALFLLLNYIDRYHHVPSDDLLLKIGQLQKEIVDPIEREEMKQLVSLYLSMQTTL